MRVAAARATARKAARKTAPRKERAPRRSEQAPRLQVQLFENVHPAAVALLTGRSFDVVTHAGAPSDRELRKALDGAAAVGIRSRTKLTADVLASAKDLLVVGCFAVGTNNVDLDAATMRGVPVFHAPHASTRSVAELTVGFLVALARRMVEKSHLTQRGRWPKDAAGSHELRGKTLAIVGYGHVGSQVSVLAESLGMRVLFFDVVDRQALGNAQRVPTLHALLPQADFVTLHVPGGAGTKLLLGARELALMKPSAHLVNTARGTVVDERALEKALRAGAIAGAALDVLEDEPASTKDRLRTPLRKLPNVIITPHVGGSTKEAQERIGEHVAVRVAKFLEEGSTGGAINFPQVELPRAVNTHRLIHVHRNVPGVLSGVNGILSALGANIEAQYLKTSEKIGYLVVDVDRNVSAQAVTALCRLPETLRARRLF